MSTPVKPAAPRKRLWLRVLFGASLAMNLLVVGLAVGAAFRFGGPDGMRAPPASFGSAMYRALSHEDRHAVRATMKRSPSDHKARRAADAQTMAAALRAIPFDVGAVEAALQAQSRRRGAWQESVQAAWLAQLTAMSDAERAAYAERLEQALKRRKHTR